MNKTTSCSSNFNNLPAWLNNNLIEAVLSSPTEPEPSILKAILDKSLALESLDLPEIATLLAVKNLESRMEIMGTADLIKQKAYGDRIVLTAPLHIDNHCASECLYCSARRDNKEIERKKLNPEEIKEAGKKLIRQGHKRVILSSGQADRSCVDYVAEAINALYRLTDGHGELRQINLNLGTLSPDEFTRLAQTDVSVCHIYQETYHEPSYKNAHIAGIKSNYNVRLESPAIALQSGIKEVSLGLCAGLGPLEYDILALALHCAYLTKEFGFGGRTINLHRMRPAPGGNYVAPYPVNDADFLYAIAVIRVALPYAGINMTTREPSQLWRSACNTGITELFTGSLANPYDSWLDAPKEKAAFPVGEDTHLDEIVRYLIEEVKHLPSFCTACPRLGRTGKEFVSIAQSGDLKGQCGPNSLAAFLEFLLNYATPYTRELGEKLLNDKLSIMDKHQKNASLRLLEEVRAGRTDEFI